MLKIIAALLGSLFFIAAHAVPNLGDTDPRNDDDSVTKIELDAYCMDQATFKDLIEKWDERPMMTANTVSRWKGNDIKGQFILFVNPTTWKYTSVIRFDDKWCITGIGTKLRPIAKKSDKKD